MLKDIIVNLGLGARDPAGDFAVSIAETFAAHVLGVAFVYDPEIPGTVIGGIPTEIIEPLRAKSESQAQTAVTRFDKAASRAGVSAETLKINGSIASAADQLGKLARRFDLGIIGQPERESFAPDEVLAESLLFESGRPVIIVPYIQKQGLKLDRVLLCWDGTRAATRAIADAMQFLEKAKQVEIVMVTNDRGKGSGIPGADLAAHLARHDIKVETRPLTAGDIDVANTILSHAADSGADMIVMGGYGHSRLREFVLGGVTRGILATMTVPTLMSH